MRDLTIYKVELPKENRIALVQKTGYFNGNLAEVREVYPDGTVVRRDASLWIPRAILKDAKVFK